MFVCGHNSPPDYVSHPIIACLKLKEKLEDQMKGRHKINGGVGYDDPAVDRMTK